MLNKLKTRKKLQALTMAMACGLLFTMGGGRLRQRPGRVYMVQHQAPNI